ncbi:MAG TPA: DNA polymerase [Candidatus Deferrimicrobium sp.]|nr:DNA polymerase [Candidatus Deferrimicrobium sp.]
MGKGKKKNYYSLSKVRSENIIFCTFDTETRGLGGKILCATYDTPTGPGIFIGDKSLIEWFDEIFMLYPYPCIHYAHFAQYDWRYLIPELLRRKELGYFDHLDFFLRTDKDIYQITIAIDGKKYIMRDSYALYPDTLEEFAKAFSPDLLKLELNFDNEIFDVENSNHLEYAKRDAMALRQCLINYATAVKNLFGVSIGHTAAGTAVKAWQKTLDKETIISYSEDSEREKYIRNAYYGGVVFLTTNKPHKKCKTYDLNSSYPYTMETFPMPVGSPTEVSEYIPNTLGIYEVDIEVPETIIIPIIPSRNERGSMQWRTGRFKTAITNFEIEMAVKNGHIIHEIKSGLVWNSTISPFKEFIGKCKYIRKAHKGTSYEKVAKRNQNSLYGKYGAKRTTNRIVFGQENIKDFENVKIFSEDMDDVYIVTEYSEDMPCKPEWAVFITAIARMRLIASAYALGPENVIYGDTDSLTLKENADISKLDIGDEYGQFKLEKEWKQFRAIAPKTYAGQLNNGKWTGAGKGLSTKKMTAAKYRELFETGMTEVTYLSLPSLVVALRKGMGEATEESRVSSSLDNSINYSLQEGVIKLKSNNYGKDNSLPAKCARSA